MNHDIIEVSEDDDGQRLDRWLKKKRPDLPHVLVQKLLRKGQVRVDGGRAKPETRLATGQKVRMPLGSAADAKGAKGQFDAEWIHKNIVYMDDELLVINKPSGLAVQGGSGLQMHLEMMLDDFAVRGVAPRLVHRLDRETSGILVMARSAAMARKMGDMFSGRDIQKTYLALVHPIPAAPKGLIDMPLDKLHLGTSMEKMYVTPEGREAQTEYRVLQTNTEHNVAAVEFKPLTGRTHQIRVHASAKGFPLLGDKKYDGNIDLLKSVKAPIRVQLHAAQLEFNHPKTGKAMKMRAPLPDDMVASWTGFGFKVS